MFVERSCKELIVRDRQMNSKVPFTHGFGRHVFSWRRQRDKATNIIVLMRVSQTYSGNIKRVAQVVG